MTEFEKYSLLVRAFGVAATFAAVIVAIWGERIRQIWNKPRLKVSLNEPAFNVTVSGIRGWYYLIRVANSKPSTPAKNVRLLLTNVYKKGPDGSWREQRFSGPTQVTWRWPQWSPLYATIGPEELSTFGSLLENSNFELQLYWYPNNLQRAIAPNDPTRFQFKAVSDIAESEPLAVEVAWDGQWAEGSAEIRQHLIVKEIKA
jgi:hypothetical protein